MEGKDMRTVKSKGLKGSEKKVLPFLKGPGSIKRGKGHY